MPRKMTIKVSEDEYELLSEARYLLRVKGLEAVYVRNIHELPKGWADLTFGAVAGIGARLLLDRLKE